LPYLDGIEWIFVQDVMTRVASFQAGEAHAITGLTAVQANELAQTGDYIMLQSPSTVFTLYMDSVNEDSPWGNVLVRKAAAYAINNEEICEAFGYGYYEPTNQIGYPGNPMYNPDIQGYPYNPDKARELLADAGYPDGFDTTIWYTSGGNDNIYQAVQAYWAEVGINAELEIVQTSRNIEISSGGWNNGVQTFIPPYMAVGYPPAKMISFYFSPMSPFSVSVMRPDDIEELRISSLSADTVEEMNAYIQEINRLLIDEYCVCIPIFVSPNLGAKVPWLHDERIYDPWMETWQPENAWLEHE
jgi:peptide/nickel transport system substrate-binding protein